MVERYSCKCGYFRNGGPRKTSVVNNIKQNKGKREIAKDW